MASNVSVGAQAVRPRVVRLVLDLLLDPRHAHLEKLIEVRRDNPKEPHAFQQRLGRVLRLFQHAAIEGQPAQFPVDEKLGITRVEGLHVGGKAYSRPAPSRNGGFVTFAATYFGVLRRK